MSLSNLLIIFSSSFMALFPVVNPLGNGFVVNGFFTDLDPKQRKTAIHIDSGPKAREMFDRYGVDGVMIGRATYGRPWIFREVKHFLETGEVMPQPSVAERVEIAKEHLAKSLEIKGGRVGILEMRRHLSNYFKGLPNFKETRLKLVTLFDPNELYATLDSIADRWGDFDVSGVIPAPLSHDV